MLNKLQRLLKAAKSGDFWIRIIVAKSIESRKDIQKLMEQQRKMDKLQNELRKYLATAYEDKVKGVMDDETSVRLNNQFKRERDQVKEMQQKIQKKFGTAQKFRGGLARFEGRSKVKLTSKLLRGILSGNSSTGLQFIQDNRNVRPYT